MHNCYADVSAVGRRAADPQARELLSARWRTSRLGSHLTRPRGQAHHQVTMVLEGQAREGQTRGFLLKRRRSLAAAAQGSGAAPATPASVPHATSVARGSSDSSKPFASGGKTAAGDR